MRPKHLYQKKNCIRHMDFAVKNLNISIKMFIEKQTLMMYRLQYAHMLHTVYICSYTFEFNQYIQFNFSLSCTSTNRRTQSHRCQLIFYTPLEAGLQLVILHGSSITTCCQKLAVSEARPLALCSRVLSSGSHHRDKAVLLPECCLVDEEIISW